ncbi:unnamed protein product [Ceutorhynchus assimilis]|uniref:tRNA (carboxymethyluridine(34)-5-O)-methyltransferase n=1 Tax=Ceutorhynchus assimilis TaxID=467358 RepID=A0A9N9MY80_9CUCU|nr:unnamed protein product [Ceutorhynchus assimilis]
MSSNEKLSIGQKKKLDRKLAKLQHVLKKESGATSSPNPTKNLAICNAGLVSGLTEEIIYEHFSQLGNLTDITLLPGKSCSFLSYDSLESSIKAYETFNGKLNIAQDNKAIYLLYVDQIPYLNDQRIWGELPPGLILLEDFISIEEENMLLNLCSFDAQPMKHRLVKHFGYEFRYDINNVDKDKPMSETLPVETNFLWSKLQQKFKPDQLTINHYTPGQGIPHHIDTHSAFEDPIICLSLSSPIIMEFKNNDKHLCFLLPQRSLLIMSEESRYDWTHGIVPRKFDIIPNNSGQGFTCLKRGTRVSFTFRKVLQGSCQCNYKSKCDSYNDIEDNVALELEAMHVHKVYNNIADHFSDTRHKPWPNVLEFVQSFAYGDILIDVGCGNGKYLGINQKIFTIGCDRSMGLIDICRQRQYEGFIGDCLSVPLKNSSADGAISIAVIHHLATEQRRLKALREMVRVLKPGGRALVYVWAHNQINNEKKSSYIMQDRKNRKVTQMDKLVTGQVDVPLQNGNVTLPVHNNRSNFQAKDVLVPWKLKDKNETTFLRFYHVFEENELEQMCQKIDNIQILKSYYDQGNWCVIFGKI